MVMMSRTPRSKRYSDAEMGSAGVRLFAKLAIIWNLSESDQARLLGDITLEMLSNWKAQAGAKDTFAVGPDTRQRLSYLLGIHRALNTLYTRPELCTRWLRYPNKDPFFNGRTPLETMLEEPAGAGLRRVHSYLHDMIETGG
jgi:hypothetical protein